MTDRYLRAMTRAILTLDQEEIRRATMILRSARLEGGRVFVIGNGGSAGNASHLVCDLRKACEIEAYAPSDNVSELTARINDDDWDSSVSGWLKVSQPRKEDVLFALSVGGGSVEVSFNLVATLHAAKRHGMKIIGIAGAPGGILANLADVAILVDAPSDLKTPVVESVQAVVWHAMVTHPALAPEPTCP